MTGTLLGQSSPRGLDAWGEDAGAGRGGGGGAVAQMGWGTKWIADELRCSRNTVKRYLAAVGWVAMRGPRRKRRLDGLEEWLAERFRRHRDSRDVVRQDLLREHGVTVSLRTVERAVVLLRQALQAEARACLRFERAPGKQLQIDFGGITVAIGGERVRVHLFVATLGYSPRPFVQAFRHERQSAWFDGMEGAFQRFGEVPQEVLFDNARGLVDYHDPATREVRFNDRLHAIARCWRLHSHACALYRARTKSLPSRQRGARTSAASATSSATPLSAMLLRAGRRSRRISSGGCARSPTGGFTALPARCRWCVFQQEEASALRPLDGPPPFCQVRELVS